MIDPTNAQRKQIERNIIALVVEHPNAHADEGWQAQLAEQVAALNSTPAEPTPEDEAKANLKAQAELVQRQGRVRQAEQDILTKAAANSPDHITPENVLTEAPDEVLRVIDTTPDVVIPRVVDSPVVGGRIVQSTAAAPAKEEEVPIDAPANVDPSTWEKFKTWLKS